MEIGNNMQHPINNDWQVYQFPNFAGGFMPRPTSTNVFSDIVNMEAQRDGSLKTIYGSRKINDNDLGGGLVTGIWMGEVYGCEFAIVVATISPLLWTSPINSPDDTNIQLPVTFVDSSGSAISNGEYWSFAQFYDTTNDNIVLATNEGNDLIFWDNGKTSADFQRVLTAPTGCNSICAYNNYLVMSKKPYSIFVSDKDDYATWPGTQEILLNANLGLITKVVALPGKLIAFCERGISFTLGSKYSQFSLNFRDVNTSIGCPFPLSISTYVSDVGFLSDSGPYIWSAGSVSPTYIGSAIEEIFISRLNVNTNYEEKLKWRGVLTRHSYILTYTGSLSSTDPLGQSDPDSGLTLIFDRRSNTWITKLANKRVDNKWAPTFSAWGYSEAAKINLTNI